MGQILPGGAGRWGRAELRAQRGKRWCDMGLIVKEITALLPVPVLPFLSSSCQSCVYEWSSQCLQQLVACPKSCHFCMGRETRPRAQLPGCSLSMSWSLAFPGDSLLLELTLYLALRNPQHKWHDLVRTLWLRRHGSIRIRVWVVCGLHACSFFKTTLVSTLQIFLIYAVFHVY